MTSNEGEPAPGGGKSAKKSRADKEAKVVDLYEETSSPSSEAASTEARESPDSGGTFGGVEDVEGFDEAQVLQEALALAESVPVTPELEALPDAGEIEFGTLPAIETICGADDRVRISPATALPWRLNCQLLITMANGGGSRCTGWLIGPRTLMTAGHCVFSHSAGGWARQIEVVPGMDAASRPFGSQVSRTLRSVTGWTSSANPEYDYGAIILPNATNLGFFGFASLPDADLRGMIGNNAGYPGDKPFGTQWFNADPISEVTARRLGYMIDTMGGQSGSAVWRLKDGARHAVGIHGYGGCPNRAVRIISPVFNNMVTWKNV
jgi:glutamyl endopeptidase